ncbi:MAG: dehydrogenase [Mesorhizobium amorphae]|nr:MAG: dehydrogenase [Mesorhizobium amorphae]
MPRPTGDRPSHFPPPVPARPLRVKAASTLVYSAEGDALLGCNFLTKQVFHCELDTLRFLHGLSDWCEAEDVAERFELSVPETVGLLERLIEVSAVVRADSEEALREQEFQSDWAWSVPTALMHFTLEDRPFLAIEESEGRQVEKAALGNLPELHSSNRHLPGQLALPDPLTDNGLTRLMARRRTVRAALDVPVALEQLSTALFAGLGIIGETTNRAGRLPLKLTPSGGARNPYEAYVFVRAVEGLQPGLYHYSAADHSLAPVPFEGELPTGGALIGGQDWADGMACTIVLCAHLQRTMWKYDDPNAYRVVMIEAGHVGQNIMLAASRSGLTACPSAALDHSLIRRTVGLTELTVAPVYALALGVPGADPEIELFARWREALSGDSTTPPPSEDLNEMACELSRLRAQAKAGGREALASLLDAAGRELNSLLSEKDPL